MDDASIDPNAVQPSRRARRRRGHPTLRDVAALAKVDASLVSRVVNDDRRLPVSDATRERVLAAVAELGYRPNIYARGLSMARTWTIGISIPNLTNPVYAQIVDGAQRRAAELGFAMIIGSPQEGQTSDSLSRLLAERRMDGLLLVSFMLDAEIRALAAGPTPVVVLHRRLEGEETCVLVDDQLAAGIATQHLIDLGHEVIAHIASPQTLDPFIRRHAGFDQAIAAAGVKGVVVDAADFDARTGFLATKRLLEDDASVTGILGSVMVAVGAIRAASELGLRIPDDLSVIGHHDVALAEYIDPPLTTVKLPLAESGASAVDALVARIEEREPEAEMVPTPPQLIVRKSTAPPPDRQVKAALARYADSTSKN